MVEVMEMRKYWIFNLLLTVSFLLVLTILYKFSFTNQELIFFGGIGATLRILGYLNYRFNYEQRNLPKNSKISSNF